ncbi:dimethylsulfonioproprionate lyase family protein [Albimonas sp. CAU 1670]|uniref:dimethylsulfonioproprionate lyase family protein n=1 Tax=Albimonas sp. CAU 1670 TaxID=3032599 RepID=UPI0023DC80E9|nr:dimethylsulfonioproprionate lyase family protein [Albimonas sp. CAU 1670]MDF2235593.1 dimethylsulfonioproprionate lyase family protein [Albimonas sp. CAU 1670]
MSPTQTPAPVDAPVEAAASDVAAAEPEPSPAAAAEPGPRLSEAPDWSYLLLEFETMYRAGGSAGGSKAIRGHRKRVRETLSAVLDADPRLIARAPQEKPVTAYLPRALDVGERGAMSALARALGRVAGRLTWEYGYARPPRHLTRRYAYCEVMGPQGPVPSERLILGFVLLAPSTTYPQHSHKEIEESYLSVAGAWSENDTAVYAPGSLILNRPEHEHRITTGDLEPCLLAYAWTGPAGRLAAPGMKLSASRKARVAHGI